MRIAASLDELLEALRAGETEMTTPESAVSSLGPLYIREMIEIAKEEQPGTTFTLWTDCGDDVGGCMMAIQEGLPHLVFRGDRDYAIKLEDMAAQKQIILKHVTASF